MTNARLFDEVDRVPPPKRPTESLFEFVNRAEGALWDQTRTLLESWYADYPDPDGDLRGRFRQDALGQHMGAWWELYIYTLFRRLGYEIGVHPVLPGTKKNPDFVLTRDSTKLVVECAVMLEEAQWGDSDGKSWVLECIDGVVSPNFRLGVDIGTEGNQRPSRKDIVRPIEAWLAALDADALWEAAEAGDSGLPEEEFEIRGWTIIVRALVVDPVHRGTASGSIAAGPMKSGVLQHAEQMRTILSDKGSKYGQLPYPFVLALLARPITAGVFEMTNALYGSVAVTVAIGEAVHEDRGLTRQGNGYWRAPPDGGGSRISAVLLGESLQPWDPFAALPRLWVNPWATVPLGALPPFAAFTVNGDDLVSTDASMTPHEIFGTAETAIDSF
ncbi:hemin-binding protein [Mycobacterium paraintracellulare]|uniref:hemin-binding protein n=1 Tax=Mycobacterium paraintracellulare TaxID=1138383 RepID=UPI001F45EDAC|nr:hemin-binding protein [Mycobacterium paraintracellulare]